MSSIVVVDWSPAWAVQFDEVAADLREALVDVPSAVVEHVGSTSVPGLAAKPILDIDVVVDAADVAAAVTALESVGHVHRGDLGVAGREAFYAPGEPRRNVYVCTAGTTNVRNHLAVRDVLRERDDLRDAYAAVKLALAADPTMDIDTYLAGKSAVLQQVLEVSGEFSDDELAAIHRLNDSSA
ncbi:GrpB family protein [Nocardioides baculatus]|uniref:GrpB family protein n=1 Tax=Nocardioides baculatus TaxID=2801337 RepID=A0ABS1L8Z4_9ACTN|nr:GrpB family protein [Nocardioides baculatus]MBL0748002.1 GrpB family protein [Nocardioides baculatus]